jgi:hypothetical protein
MHLFSAPFHSILGGSEPPWKQVLPLLPKLHLCNGSSAQSRDIGRRACEVVSCDLRAASDVFPTQRSIKKRAFLDRLVNVVITKAL